MRIMKWFLGIVLLLSIVYIVGPNPSTPIYTATLPTFPSNPAELEATIHSNEKNILLDPTMKQELYGPTIV